jgi:hypothetical protein
MRLQERSRVEPARALASYSCVDGRCVGGIISTRLHCTTRQSTKYVQHCERHSGSGIPELDQILLAPRHEKAHRWVALDEAERQPVPGHEFPTRRTCPYATALWRPLETTSGGERTNDT